MIRDLHRHNRVWPGNNNRQCAKGIFALGGTMKTCGRFLEPVCIYYSQNEPVAPTTFSVCLQTYVLNKAVQIQLYIQHWLGSRLSKRSPPLTYHNIAERLIEFTTTNHICLRRPSRRYQSSSRLSNSHAIDS